MGAIENILAFFFVLGVMVLIHELGHFWAARYFKVRVQAFAFGIRAAAVWIQARRYRLQGLPIPAGGVRQDGR